MRESQLEGLRARIAALEPLEAALAQSEARVLELEAALPASAPAAAMPSASAATRLPELPAAPRRGRARNGNERDDLKRIPGIGPATERVLHSAGVYTFRQIANWRREEARGLAGATQAGRLDRRRTPRAPQEIRRGALKHPLRGA